MEYSYTNDYKTQVMNVVDESQRMLDEKEVHFRKMLGIEEERQEIYKDRVDYLEANLQ